MTASVVTSPCRRSKASLRATWAKSGRPDARDNKLTVMNGAEEEALGIKFCTGKVVVVVVVLAVSDAVGGEGGVRVPA